MKQAISDLQSKPKWHNLNLTPKYVLQNKDKYFLDSSDKISYFFEGGALGPKGELLVEPEKSLNKIGHALHALNPVFRKVTFSERVKEAAFQLGFDDPAVVQSMYIFKNPGVGSEGKHFRLLRYNFISFVCKFSYSPSRRVLPSHWTGKSNWFLVRTWRRHFGERLFVVLPRLTQRRRAQKIHQKSG